MTALLVGLSSFMGHYIAGNSNVFHENFKYHLFGKASPRKNITFREAESIATWRCCIGTNFHWVRNRAEKQHFITSVQSKSWTGRVSTIQIHSGVWRTCFAFFVGGSDFVQGLLPWLQFSAKEPGQVWIEAGSLEGKDNSWKCAGQRPCFIAWHNTLRLEIHSQREDDSARTFWKKKSTSQSAGLWTFFFSSL